MIAVVSDLVHATDALVQSSGGDAAASTALAGLSAAVPALVKGAIRQLASSKSAKAKVAFFALLRQIVGALQVCLSGPLSEARTRSRQLTSVAGRPRQPPACPASCSGAQLGRQGECSDVSLCDFNANGPSSNEGKTARSVAAEHKWERPTLGGSWLPPCFAGNSSSSSVLANAGSAHGSCSADSSGPVRRRGRAALRHTPCLCSPRIPSLAQILQGGCGGSACVLFPGPGSAVRAGGETAC